MARWEFVESTPIPAVGKGAEGELALYSREMAQGDEYAIRIKGQPGDLMNSRTHASEDALGTLAAQSVAERDAPNILVGGLGMGFTLAAVLHTLGATARVVVAELVPGVIAWDREWIGHFAGQPLLDQRVAIETGDVHDAIDAADHCFDAILLDVDNGPEGLTHKHNDRLYSDDGLLAARNALRSGGVLAIWSASTDPRFVARLKRAGFKVDERRVRAHGGRGSRHVIWLAQKD